MPQRKGLFLGGAVVAVLAVVAVCASGLVSVIGVPMDVTADRMAGTWSCDNGFTVTLRADHTFDASSLMPLAGEPTRAGTLDFSVGSGGWSLGTPTGDSQPTPMILNFTAPRSFVQTIQVEELRWSTAGYETGFRWGGADEGSGGCDAWK